MPPNGASFACLLFCRRVEAIRVRAIANRDPTNKVRLWLIGYELPRIYEKFFRKPFGATLTSREYGPGIRFILLVLEAAGIVSSTGSKYSAITIKTYRRRARKYAQR